MPKEESAGAVLFRLQGDAVHYLLLHYPSSGSAPQSYWDLPKGHIEEGETKEETVKREVQEETGVAGIQLLDGFSEAIHYWFQSEGKTISKTVTFYLARVEQEEITISKEHIGYQWLPYEKALQELTYENAKQVVRKAHAFLGGSHAF